MTLICYLRFMLAFLSLPEVLGWPQACLFSVDSRREIVATLREQRKGVPEQVWSRLCLVRNSPKRAVKWTSGDGKGSLRRNVLPAPKRYFDIAVKPTPVSIATDLATYPHHTIAKSQFYIASKHDRGTYKTYSV